MSAQQDLCAETKEFVHTKLADLADFFMVGVIAIALLIAALNWSFLLPGDVLPASFVGGALCYLLASRSLRRREDVGYERVFIAACAMASGIWLFELVYHYGWVESWALLSKSFTSFDINLPSRGKPFPLPWAFLMVSLVLVGWRHVRLNRWFLIVLAFAVPTFLLWMAVGYPSHNQPWRSPELAEVIKLIPHAYAHPSSPNNPGWAFIVSWGLLFTSVTKVLIGILPATLFMHHLGKTGGDGFLPADDALVRAWRRVLILLGLQRFAAPESPRQSPPAPLSAEGTALGGERLERDNAPGPPEALGMAAPADAVAGTTALMRPQGKEAGWVGRIHEAARFLKPKLPDLADLFMVGVIAFSVAASIVKQSLILTDGLLAGSLVGFALCYLLASRSLRDRPELGLARIFISLCAMASAIWLFEIIWRLWGFDTWQLVPQQLSNLTFADPWPLSWALLMVGLAFVGVRYMRLNKWFFATLALAIFTFWVWRAAGFPQFPHPEWWPSKYPSIPFIPIEYRHPTTEQARATVVFWGALLNSVTKVFFCALPGTLYLTRENWGGPLRNRIWPPWPALKRLLMPWKEWGAAPGTSAAAVAPGAAATAMKEPHGGQPPVAKRSVCDIVGNLVRTNLADWADLFMVAIIIVVAGVAVANHTFVLTGRVLAGSIIAYAVAYLIASRSLRRCEGIGYERIFIAACAMVSGIWLFEIISHYGWLASWEQLSRSLTDFNIRPPNLREPFPLMWSFIMISVVFVGARYMRVNRWFYIVLALAVTTVVLWLAVGYPSFRDPWRSPQQTEVVQLIPPSFAHPRNPASEAWGYIAFWGAIFVSLTKLFVCMLPATLFVHNIKRGETSGGASHDDLLARAWREIRRRLPLSRSGTAGTTPSSAGAPESRRHDDAKGGNEGK